MYYIEKYISQPIHWYRWEEREEIPGNQLTGVYLLAFLTNQNKKVVTFEELLCKEVIYIGETHRNGRSLSSRWDEFERAARTGNSGHAGGKTFHELALSLKGLFLAALSLPESVNELELKLSIMLIERELLWEFGQRFYCRPKCNKA